MKSQVLADRLLPAGSPSMSDCSDTGVSVVTGRPAPAQTEPSLIAQLWPLLFPTKRPKVVLTFFPIDNRGGIRGGMRRQSQRAPTPWRQ